jgi:D-proline reductase (dithiol) PrdB
VVTIQRAIEMTGVSTILVTVDPEQTRAARPPRALCPAGFPIGQSLGRPGEVALQARLLRDALQLLVRYPEEPGTIVTRDYR